MPVDYNGTWNMVSNENFEGWMLAIGIDYPTRKIANFLKPQKVIEQNGDNFTMKTVSTFRNYNSTFKMGEEFEEVTKGLDNRTCQTVVNWEGDKIVCVQKGEKNNRGWTHWIDGDQLYLELRCEDQVCRQIYKKSP
ncbi:retinoid-binding protein 7-like [Megalops cyprinoides]|uniref:retinoid-binding protein 7-like n=1 Tax=Megalops cyprinoides TaxID=118141 RepID=UPI0018647744|nr:retinoid-binding protein 7-like [Megalops cyprinoides]